MARVELGLSDDEFWRLTPAQFFKLMEANDEKIKREDARFGMLLTVVARVAGSKDVQPGDFFPSLAVAKKEKNAPDLEAFRRGMKAVAEYQKAKKA